ncbi:hypothetical protein BD770DRAFT_323947, partial [Pilaira anomala]
WNETTDKQEFTSHRRFARYLDTLLLNTGIRMTEYVRTTEDVQAVKLQLEQLTIGCFMLNDISATYLCKIDLMLKFNNRKSIDLCSNECNRSKVPKELKLKQQSKNLRVNACIINSLDDFRCLC